jgi:RNA polymerase sigma-70 factor (sigma-E family)
MSISTEGADFDSYVRASGPRLKRVAYLLTGDLSDAEDLLQTAYAKVFPHWQRVLAGGNPDAYLRRVMVNTRTSWWRRLRDREFASDSAHERSAAPGDHAERQADLDRVLRALRTLPRRQQVAVVLRHYCDLSEAEIAALMGTSVGTVKSQVSKGCAALRTVLAPSAPVREG